MYTEIVKIVEAALALDRKRVASFANVLAGSLERKGEVQLAMRIRKLLEHSSGGAPVMLDAFGVKPVDGESRLDIVDVTCPSLADSDLVLERYVLDEVNDFVASYEKRDRLVAIGASVGSALLLYGPPGCGKTSVARLIASRVRMPLVTARFDTLVSSLLGSTSKNIRKVFDYAAQRPCVLFLDEFDVIAKMRDDRNELGEIKRVVNGLLQAMDDFSPEHILIAASNHQELLDNAVWRRFNRILKLDLPTTDATEKLLYLYLNGRDDGFLISHHERAKVVAALAGRSPSDVHTCVMNALKGVVIAGREKVAAHDVVKEAYLLRHHAFADNRAYVAFLLSCGFSIRMICEAFGFPERLVRGVSAERNREVHA